MKKDKIHIDSQFLDDSWQEMAKLLDKEMPVKKKKRRFIWLWFLGLGLLIGMSIISYSLNENASIDAMPIPEKAPIAIEKNKLKTNKINTNKIETASLTNLHKDKQSPDNQHAITTKRSYVKPTATNKLAKISDEDNFEPTILNLSKNKKISVNSLLSNQTEAIKKNTPVIQKTKADLNQIPFGSFNPIPKLGFHLLTIDEIDISIPITPLKTNPRWRFGLYASKAYPKLGSFTIGLHSNIAFRPRWSLNIGLGYSRKVAKINHTIINPPQPSTADTSGNNDPTGIQVPTATEMDLETSTSNFEYRHFNYFELPIILQYQINPRWSLEFGGQISRLYGYRYQLDENSDYTSNFNVLNFQTTRAVDLNNSTVSSWDFAALGGIGFKFSPNIHAYTNYNFSFNEYLSIKQNETINTKKWKQIEFGIRYYFK